MRTNVARKPRPIATHEGGAGVKTSAYVELERAVGSCLLFERQFYEGWESIAQRIAKLCDHVPLEDIGSLAISARFDLKLRHVPLWLALQAVRINSERKLGSDVPSQTLFSVINRPDEIPEAIAMYWREGRRPIAKQLKKGLALAFTKFDTEYELAKWNRDREITLRDSLFLCHAAPATEEQALLWKKLVDGQLETPETWEAMLSAGKDKKETWEYLLTDGKLGIMAMLMNCRAMMEVGVDRNLLRQALLQKAPGSWALPGRFLSAAKHAPAMASALSDAMLLSVAGRYTLSGETLIVVDVSGSMDEQVSSRSQLTRLEAAAALAVLAREACADCRVFTFSNQLVEVEDYRGIPLTDVIARSQFHGGTALRAALSALTQVAPNADRVIVITDEQSQDGTASAWCEKAYLMNVASYEPALSVSGGWKRVSGFSERLIDWIVMEEQGKIAPAEEED